jgi:type IV pilus assembly protein PilC
MPVFTYSARNEQGRPQRGTQESASAPALVRDLRQRGWLVLDVKPVTAAADVTTILARLNPLAWLPPRSIDIELSLQQIAVMLRSGLTLLTALRSVAEYAGRASLRRIWVEIAQRIQEGSGFADALAKYPRFPRLVIHLARVGEQTGTLDAVIARAAETMERRRILRTQIVTAMMYSIIVVTACIGVLLVDVSDIVMEYGP